MIKFDFSGKTVLVTGSSRGMGASIREAFAAAGANCLLQCFNDPTGQKKKDADGVVGRLRANGGKITLVDADVRQAGDIEKLMNRVKNELGGIDVLVNNAGVIRDRTV